jgi:hypothetical protein
LPYCKTCHIKNFGTRDLRHANLPYREDGSLSPTKTTQPPPPLPPRVTSPTRADPPPLLRPTRSLATSPTGIRSPTFPRNNSDLGRTLDKDTEADSLADGVATPPVQSRTQSPPPTLGATGNLSTQGQEEPISPTVSGSNAIIAGTMPTSTPRPTHHSSRSVGSVMPATTGTRYGALLNRPGTNVFAGVNLTGSNATGSPRRWGGDTPVCPKCGQNVYFAEQVKAVGKTFHKGCLRCFECNTLLDSSRLRDHNGDPLCMRCYGKLHGPQGGGYALLGKAGG